MDAITAVTTVVGLIGQMLPLLSAVVPGGAVTTTAIGGIISTLIKFEPLIQSEIGTVYTGVKNIINTLGKSPATTAEQLKTLREFDAKVDAHWDAIESKIDPDIPGND